MKRVLYSVIIIVIILIVLIVIKNYPEKGKFEEVIYSKYEYKDKFIRMEIYGGYKTKESNNINQIHKLTKYLSDIKIKENYLNTNSEETNNTYFIYLTSESNEWLDIHINDKIIDVKYKTLNIDSRMKESHKEYIIIDEDFDIRKIEEIYNSIGNEK